jgi:hypothetical protein
LLHSRYCIRIYYVKKNDGNKLADREWDALTSTDSRYKFYSQYMPKISNTNNLVPAPIYLENLDCYAVLFAKRNGTTLWRQPIIIL